MIRKRILILGAAMLIGLSSTIPTLAETAPSITMENSGPTFYMASGRLWKWTVICNPCRREYH